MGIRPARAAVLNQHAERKGAAGVGRDKISYAA